MNKREILICLGAGKAQLPLIDKAHQEGFSILAFDQNPNVPGASVADLFINISTYDVTAVIHQLEKLEQQYKYIGLLSRVSGPALYTAAAISKRFELPGLNETAVQLSTEKAALRNFCHDNNLPFPKGKQVARPTDLDLSELDFPVILKPDLPLVGKEHIFLLSKSDQVDSMLNQVRKASYNGFAEVEEYIHGIDVSCLFWLNHGSASIIACWDELIVLEKGFKIRGIGVSTPSVIKNTQIYAKIESAINKISKKLNDINTIMAISLRVDFDGDIHIIELHSDMTGDLILDVLLPVAYFGKDFFSIPVKIVTGNKPELNFSDRCRPTAVLYQDKSFTVIHEKRLQDLLEKVNVSFCSPGMTPNHLSWFTRYGVLR